MKNISDLTSPLFDVASEKQKTALYENPYNSIHLSIPWGDCPSENAARILQQWRDAGCIQRDSDRIEYERGFAACLTNVIQGACQLALITNEVSIGDVKTVCRSGCTLPQKSTYFWPKVICGLVFSSL
jgi:uncharacterized protein (DUF1015 family)